MDYQNDRFGSASPTPFIELKKAQIIGGSGISFGYDKTRRHKLAAAGDGSVALFCGPGGGKSAAIFQGNLIDAKFPGNFLCFDPRGENLAVSMLALSLAGYSIYVVNPAGLLGLPQHRVNPLDHLTINSRSLIGDIQKLALDLCPSPSGAKSSWAYDDARRWLNDLLLFDVERNGCATLAGVFELLTNIQGDVERWCDRLEEMQQSRFPTVRTFANEIITLQQSGRDGFTAPYGVLLSAFEFMRDPRLQDMFGGSDFSLQDLVLQPQIAVFVVWPIEYVRSQAPAIRLIHGSAIQAKFRSPGGIPLSMLIDECGQLGKQESIREMFTFGRGAGLINNLCAWQEVSQIRSSIGNQADEIIGSAQYRVFKSVRTVETAHLVSQMAGTMTLPYDDENNQSNAKRLKQHAAHQLLSGINILQAASDLRHYQLAAEHQVRQARPVLTPDEVLNLPASAMVAFASGKVEGAILGHWINHFDRRDLRGRFLPNPYHDAERVRIKSTFGHRLAPIVEESVPDRLAHLPQYASGYWRYVSGFRPRI